MTDVDETEERGGRTLAFRVAYDGSRFHGSQLQPDAPTVQGAVEEALAAVLPEPVRIRLAGRTDAGVHATGQVIAFEPGVPIPLPAVRDLVNAKAGPAVRLLDGWEARSGFHPRFDAVARRYRYILHAGGAPPDPFRAPRVTFDPRPLDWERLRAHLDVLVGEHDFYALCAKPEGERRTRRRLDRLDLSFHGPYAVFELESRAFLRGQVRYLLAALLDVGAGDRAPGFLDEVLARGARREKDPTLAPAPPHGLYLVEVVYPEGLPGPACEPARGWAGGAGGIPLLEGLGEGGGGGHFPG